MTAPIAVIRTMPEMVAAYRARIAELGLTHASVDALTGLPDGYTSKIMCGMKNPGTVAIELLNSALAMAFVPTVDREQIASVEKRWARRTRPNLSIQTEIPVTRDLQADLGNCKPLKPTRLSMQRIWGSMGGKRRAKRLKKRQRQRIATHAARKRWEKARATV